MSINLFLRPLQDATVQYEYKTDVLSTYNNLEDRVAQRDIPRIFFNYNYAITDYKKAIDLDTELQKNGSVGGVWLPDWLSGITVNNVVEGINNIAVDKNVNLAEEQIILLFADDAHYEVSQIRSVVINENDAEIEFRSASNYTQVYIMPVFECFLEGENKQSRINTLSNTFSVQAVVKSPVFSAIRPHDVQFLGHDVLCDNFKITNNEPDLTISQQIQENDYEIGLKDRFTFFDRMYGSFTVTIMAKQSERDYVRNFIKRRWGKTYSCFIPSGVADFVKHDNGQQITNTLNVVNSDFDFEARPFIAIYANNEVWYAKVVSANKGAEITTLALDAHITHVILGENSVVQRTEEVSQLDIYPRDIECIQSLFFARFNDDTITFEIAGSSDDFEDVYSIEMPFIETEFYDSDNINYDTVDGIVVDKDVLFEVKSFTSDVLPSNDNNNPYVVTTHPKSGHSGGVVYSTTIGKYEGTYAYNGMAIGDKTDATDDEKDANSEVDRWLINATQDFVLQIECKFNSTSQETLTNSLVTGSCSHHKIDIGLAKGNDGNMYPCVAFHIRHTSYMNPDSHDVIVLTKFNGDIFDDYHEIAIQRTNGITYVYCDGYLNGSSVSCRNEKLFKGKCRAGRLEVYYLLFGSDFNSNITYQSCGYVQQCRLMLNKNIYTGTEMGVMNRIYYLFDYALDKITDMDNATIIKTDFIYDCLRDNWASLTQYTTQDDMIVADLDIFGQDLCQHPTAQYENTITGNSDDPYKWSSATYMDSRVKRNTTYIDLSTRYFHLSLSKYKLPYRWHKDLWFEFEISKSGEVADGQVLLYAENIMPTIYIDNDTWSVGAFGLNPHNNISAVWNSTSDHLNVAISIDSQYNRVCVYIDGQLSLSDTLINVILRNEHGSIGFWPLISEKVNLLLHKFRLVDSCLTHDDSYNVSELWNLGYRTTFFDFEFGRKHTETYPTLRITNINAVQELCPIYDVIQDTDYKKDYTYLWSDGSRADKIVNPTGNTLYTVVVTNRLTNDKGYGWFFVHKDFTGEICHSDMSCVDTYDEQGSALHINHFGMVRYDFAEQKYRDTEFWRSSGMSVVQDDNGYRLNCGWAYGTWDFFGEVDSSFVAPSVVGSYSSFTMFLAYHRYYIDNYIKQIEMVIFPKAWSANSFYDSDNVCTYDTQHSPLSYAQGTLFNVNPSDPNEYSCTMGNYFQYLNSHGTDVLKSGQGGYSADYWYDSHWAVTYTPKYTTYKAQNIVYQDMNLMFGGYDSGGYAYGDNYFPNKNWIALDRNYMKPIHIVIEPMLMPLQGSGSYGTSNMTIGYRNIWINGQRYNIFDLLRNATVPNNPVDTTTVVFNGLPENPDDFVQRLISSSNITSAFFPSIITHLHSSGDDVCISFLKKTVGSIGGCFGFSLNNDSHMISGFACYDYIKYTENFDATEKLNHYN